MPNGYTVTELAKIIGISRQALDRRIKAHKIKPEVYGILRVISANDAERLKYPSKVKK